MILLQLLFTSISFADDSLDKKVFLLQRAIKNNDCGQASEMIEKLLVENPDYTDFWKVKAEVDQCLNKDDFSVYLSYETYLEKGGSKDDVSIAMSELEENLYSVRFEISTDKGTITDWSKIDVSLDSKRFVQERDGVYLLKYSPSKEYTLIVNSTNPLIESTQRSFSGNGYTTETVELSSFDEATLTIPSYAEGLSLQVYPANSPSKPLLGKTGDHTIGAGQARIEGVFKGEKVTYNVDVSAGSNDLELPWMYSIVYEDKALVTHILPPEEVVVSEDKYSIKSPFEGTEELFVTYTVEQKQGEYQTLEISKEAFESTDLYKELQSYEKYKQVSDAGSKKTNLIYLTSGIGFLITGGVQFLALQDGNDANAITSENKYDEFQSLSDSAYGKQRIAMALGGISVATVGAALYLGKSSEVQEELSETEKKIEELKNVPIIIE